MDPILDQLNLDESVLKQCKECLIGITPSILAQMGHLESVKKLVIEFKIRPMLASIIVCTAIDYYKFLPR